MGRATRPTYNRISTHLWQKQLATTPASFPSNLAGVPVHSIGANAIGIGTLVHVSTPPPSNHELERLSQTQAGTWAVITTFVTHLEHHAPEKVETFKSSLPIFEALLEKLTKEATACLSRQGVCSALEAAQKASSQLVEELDAISEEPEEDGTTTKWEKIFSLLAKHKGSEGTKKDTTTLFHNLLLIRNHFTQYLEGEGVTIPPQGKEPIILVAKALTCAQLESLRQTGITLKGIVLETGGEGSHMAQDARDKLSLPVLVMKNARAYLDNGRKAIVDGLDPQIIVDPTQGQQDAAVAKEKIFQEILSERYARVKEAPTQTAGVLPQPVTLLANFHPELPRALLKNGATDGIGLLRLGSIIRQHPELCESAQDKAMETYLTETLGSIANHMGEKPVTVRIADFGRGKMPPTGWLQRMPIAAQDWEEPGFGGILVYTIDDKQHLDIMALLKLQVRAILKAHAKHPNIRLLFPMVQGQTHASWAKEVVESCLDELQIETPRLAIGMMVEKASTLAGNVLGTIVSEADFISFGINDLLTHILGFGRENERFKNERDLFHPSVLWFLRTAAQAATEQNKPVFVCGRGPNDPLFLLILIGLGIPMASVSPNEAPLLKYVVCNTTQAECRDIATAMLENPRLNQGEMFRDKALEIAKVVLQNDEVKPFLDKQILAQLYRLS